MPHPCRSRLDTSGDPTVSSMPGSVDTGGDLTVSSTPGSAGPRFKMHACESTQATVTLCGLGQVLDIDVTAGYKSVCRKCWPAEREMAWTPEGGSPGDIISPAPPPPATS
jgi:hypothetical protein